MPVLGAALSGCGTGGGAATTAPAHTPAATPVATPTATSTAAAATPASSDAHPQVQIVMKDGGTIVMELYPEYAPQTVAHFLELVNKGFYDGLTFHRVVDNFMAQGGDPKGDGTGGSGTTVKGEFAQNGWAQDTLKFTRGVVGLARGPASDTGDSQFFIMYNSNAGLDGNYCAFGKIVSGMDVVDGFLKIQRTMGGDGAQSKPVTPIVMSKVTEI